MNRLGAGRSADVFALDQHRVLRRYRDGGDVAEEAAVMAHVGRYRVPVPTVYAAGGADLVLERLTGPTLWESLIAGQTAPRAAGRLVADLHTRLHEVPPRRSADPADRILHLDLHPDNVILTPGRPVLIDWRNAREGPPDLDLALTALIIGEVLVGLHVPGGPPPGARELLAAFLDYADGDPASAMDRAWAMRAADPGLSGDEKTRLGAAAGRVRAALD